MKDYASKLYLKEEPEPRHTPLQLALRGALVIALFAAAQVGLPAAETTPAAAEATYGEGYEDDCPPPDDPDYDEGCDGGPQS